MITRTRPVNKNSSSTLLSIMWLPGSHGFRDTAFGATRIPLDQCFSARLCVEAECIRTDTGVAYKMKATGRT